MALTLEKKKNRPGLSEGDNGTTFQNEIYIPIGRDGTEGRGKQGQARCFIRQNKLRRGRQD